MSSKKPPKGRNPIAIHLLSFKGYAKKNKKRQIPRKRKQKEQLKTPGIRD